MTSTSTRRPELGELKEACGQRVGDRRVVRSRRRPGIARRLRALLRRTLSF